MELTAGLVLNVSLAAGAMLLVGLLAYFMLRLGDYARYATEAGIATLASLKWREFANLLGAMFRTRGFEPVERDTRSRTGGGYDLLFTRGTARYLLVCKHGTSYRVDRADTDQFLMTMRTQGAEGGFLITLGHVDPDARQAVYARNLELYDGRELWRELQRFMPRELTDQALARAAATRLGLTRRAGLLGVLTGVLTFIGASLLSPTPSVPIAAAPVATTLAPGDSASSPATPAGSAPVLAEDAAQPSTAAAPSSVPANVHTQAQLAERRATVVAAVRKVPGVVTADWSTNSTLLVTMEALENGKRDPAVAGICAEFAGYEEMNWTRLQMIEFTDTREGTAPVRWHQCR